MCGIVGFTGNHQAAPILLDGLSKLEYRGYDQFSVFIKKKTAAIFLFQKLDMLGNCRLSNM